MKPNDLLRQCQKELLFNRKTDKWIVSGIYIGIDKDAMGVIVKDYKLYNATGDEFDTPECSIATVPLNRIEYTSLTYPEDSKVKKSWFDN